MEVDWIEFNKLEDEFKQFRNGFVGKSKEIQKRILECYPFKVGDITWSCGNVYKISRISYKCDD